jgi:Glycosyltransferase family 92
MLDPAVYLSVCAVYRNEAAHLREWVEFHRLVGVERMFLYDNGSTDDHRDVLAPYQEQGLVVVHDWPQWPAQVEAYNDCLARHTTESRWIAFIDADQFLFSPTGRRVPEVLSDFAHAPGVGVNHMNFGTSGHRTPPTGLLIESFVHVIDNPRAKRVIRSIVDPARTVSCAGPHMFTYRDGALAVTENGDPVKGPLTERPSHSKLRINHYGMKSEQELAAHNARRTADGTPRTPRPPKHGDDRDETIQMYLPALREALARTAAG